ncbi:MAG: flagellar biosynthesis protein FliQ [Deltaproteobacteria bacterium]|jgi:flagellar biosynthesis protein FliQ|nr:flagellar biosynthesis protein FliQ [Deltaproteobacteria bacterium]
MPEYFIGVAKQTLFLALILTGPPVMGALLVGLTISILQATTQIQEQTLTFVPKLFVVVAVLAIAGPWMLAQLISFATSLYSSIPIYVQ